MSLRCGKYYYYEFYKCLPVIATHYRVLKYLLHEHFVGAPQKSKQPNDIINYTVLYRGRYISRNSYTYCAMRLNTLDHSFHIDIINLLMFTRKIDVCVRYNLFPTSHHYVNPVAPLATLYTRCEDRKRNSHVVSSSSFERSYFNHSESEHCEIIHREMNSVHETVGAKKCDIPI